MAVRQAALVSVESALEACACSRQCAIQIDDLLPFTIPFSRDGFKNSISKAKAKASGTCGQG